jgi:hypothetical protein
MTEAKPEWFDYAEWDYSDPSFPVFKGLRKDTPPEIVERLVRERRERRRHRDVI